MCACWYICTLLFMTCIHVSFSRNVLLFDFMYKTPVSLQNVVFRELNKLELCVSIMILGNN